MNYNQAELCKDCKQPVEKFNIPRPTLEDGRKNSAEYRRAWQKIVDKVLKRVKHKEWPFTGEDMYELIANNTRYRGDDPGDVVNQAMQDKGWANMLRYR